MKMTQVRRRLSALVLAGFALVACPVAAFAQAEMVGQWTLIPERSDNTTPIGLNPLGFGGTVAVENNRLVTSGTPRLATWPADRVFPLDDGETSYVVQGSNDNAPSIFTSRSITAGTALVVLTGAREDANRWTYMFTMSVNGSGELEVVVTTPNLGPAGTSSILRYRYRREEPQQAKAER